MLENYLKNNVFNTEIRPKIFKSFFLEIWDRIYFFDSNDRLMGPEGAYTRAWLDLITSFFGLPFFRFNNNLKLNSFLKDFFGWDEENFLLPINIIRVGVIFPFNLLLIIPRFFLNVLKLVAEFIPSLIMQLTNDWINELLKYIKTGSRYSVAVKFFSAIPLVLLFPLHFAFKVAYLVGRAITSPDKSLYAAWQAGEDLAGTDTGGKVTGGFFCFISLVVTTLMYLILFPLAIKLAVTYMPSPIVTGIQNTLNVFAPLSKLGAPLQAITAPILKAMGPFFAKAGSDVLLGIAVLVGMTAGPLVILLDKILDKVNERLMKFSTEWRRLNRQKVEAQKKPNPQKPQQQQNNILSNQKGTLQRRERFKQNPLQQQQLHQNIPDNKRGAAQPQPQPAGQVRQMNKQQNINQPAPVAPVKKAFPQKILWSDLQQEKKLGEGGFGIVYYGKYQETTPVALKQIKEGFNFLNNAEYQREIEIMAKLDSPYIVHFYGVCIVKAMIVMEYVSNGSLWDVLRSEQCPAWKGRYRIGLDITEGLFYLHGQNIIHADLKSLNVLITEDFRAKITDFGLAKIKAGKARNAVTLLGPSLGDVGTTRWMAPELFETNAKTSKESDAYSYGMILWELGAKELPFKNIEDNHQIPLLVNNGTQEVVTKDTPPKMAAVISRCWFQNPAKRPSMQDALNELTQEFNTYKFKQ